MTVFKTYDDDNETAVTVTVSCTGGGEYAENPLPAAPGDPAIFTYSGYTGDPICTAVESDVPDGYTTDNDDCVDFYPPDSDAGECTIVNTLRTGTLTVFKTYDDDNETPVTVTASCTDP